MCSLTMISGYNVRFPHTSSIQFLINKNNATNKCAACVCMCLHTCDDLLTSLSRVRARVRACVRARARARARVCVCKIERQNQ
jgi:hypothetical protein